MNRSILGVLWVILVALTLVSCDAAKEKKASNDEPEAAKNPQTELVASVSGNPVEFVSAVAFKNQGSYEVYLSSHARDCAYFARNMRSIGKGEEIISFTIANLVVTQETREKGAWNITHTAYRATTRMGAEDVPALDSVTELPDKVQVGVTGKIEGTDWDAEGKPTIFMELKGKVEAEICTVERERYDDEPLVELKEPLTITIDGTPHTFKGAKYTIKDENKSRLTFTLDPATCGTTNGGDIEVYIEFSADEPEKRFVWLGGRRVATQTMTTQQGGIEMESKEAGEKRAITLSGKSDLMVGTIDFGTATFEALVCDKR